MAEPDTESWAWRLVYGVAMALVLTAFLLSLRAILNPFLLFLLLLLLLSPFAGTRMHLLLVSAAGLLTGVWLLETTGFLLAPFFLSLAFAYVMHPMVERLERRGLPRGVAIGLLSLPLVAGLTLAVLVGIPALSREIAQFIKGLPQVVQAGIDWIERAQRSLATQDIPLVNEEVLLQRLRGIRSEDVVGYIEASQAEIARRAWQAVLGAGRGISSILTVLGYVFLTPILTFYLLRDWNRITEWLSGFVPRARRARVMTFAGEYDRLLSRYLRGQLVAAAAVGVLTWLGFWLLGFPYALLLGVVAGVFNIVPYLGLIVSLVPALIIAVFSGSFLLSLGKIALVFGVVQTLDSSVIGPRIVGESVGLHPVWVILALAVAGFFFGFVGLLLAVPIAVLLKLVLEEAVGRYRRSHLFLGTRDASTP